MPVVANVKASKAPTNTRRLAMMPMCSTLFALALMVALTDAWSQPLPPRPQRPPQLLGDGSSPPDDVLVLSRRQILSDSINVAARCACALSSADLVAGGIVLRPRAVSARMSDDLAVMDRANFRYRDDWTGSNLKWLSISDAASLVTSSSSDNHVLQLEMGRWPDPILRRPANPIPWNMLGTEQLKVVGHALRKTARAEGAVGLAAQQCGVDGRMVWIDTSSEGDKRPTSTSKRKMLRGNKGAAQVGEGMSTNQNDGDDNEGLFLINPRITWRSSEMEMLPWTETCLVLPPNVSATVLRDASISVEYETLQGETKSISLDRELARCVQHEMDHDRGILIVDHIDLGEMEGGEEGTMAMMERKNHPLRMASAYERYVSEPTLQPRRG